MANRPPLDPATLKKDLEGAQRALGVKLEIREEADASANLRVETKRIFRVALASATKVRARFVKQGWAEEAKKIFVKEIEVGEKTFDDAVYVATDTPEPTRALLGNARAREALVALVKRDSIVDVRPDELVVTHDHAVGPSADEAAEVLALAACLLPES